MLGVLGTVTLVLGVIALFAWSPWKEATGVEWLGTYRVWSDGIDAALQAGLVMSRTDCEATFDEEVGQPQEELQAVAATARRGCAALSPAGWRNGKADVVRALIDAHDDALPPRRRRDVSEIAESGVGVRPDVYCWQSAGWAPFAEQYAIVRGGEEASLRGIADSARNRIHLDPGVCAGLRWYLRRLRPTSLSFENFEMAEALMVLTHQAEHLKAPRASETEVECYAVQHVRPLVRAAGWGAEYAAELARQAWESVVPAAAAGVPQFRVSRRRPARPQSRLERLAVTNAPSVLRPGHRPRRGHVLEADVARGNHPGHHLDREAARPHRRVVVAEPARLLGVARPDRDAAQALVVLVDERPAGDQVAAVAQNGPEGEVPILELGRLL